MRLYRNFSFKRLIVLLGCIATILLYIVFSSRPLRPVTPQGISSWTRTYVITILWDLKDNLTAETFSEKMMKYNITVPIYVIANCKEILIDNNEASWNKIVCFFAYSINSQIQYIAVCKNGKYIVYDDLLPLLQYQWKLFYTPFHGCPEK